MSDGMMFKIPWSFKINKPVVPLRSFENFIMRGIGIPEASCFSLEQFERLAVGTVFATVKLYGKIVSVRYYTVVDGVLLISESDHLGNLDVIFEDYYESMESDLKVAQATGTELMFAYTGKAKYCKENCEDYRVDVHD